MCQVGARGGKSGSFCPQKNTDTEEHDNFFSVATAPTLRGSPHGGSQSDQCQIDGAELRAAVRRDSAGRGGLQLEVLEDRQRAAVDRSRERCAAGVGDLGEAEAEHLELCQPSSRRRHRTCRRRRRRHEGGDALVAERVVAEIDILQRGPPPQGRREGHQPCVSDGGVAQLEYLEPWQGASAQGGGKRRGACVAHMHTVKSEGDHGRQRAHA
eukprot:scaffold19439_cov56-Phaeocystis_antarctica.AAC.5